MQPELASRHRLDGLVRPELDPSAWTGADLATEQPVLVCLVSREIGLAARKRVGVKLPDIVDVLEVFDLRDEESPLVKGGDPRGEMLVVLEYIEGPTLEELVRGGAGDPESAVRVMLSVADAVAAMHATGVFHGGVTPLAITVLEEGTIRLGLAGIQDSALAYQSPSRLCDEGLSAQDDTWAVLACLYFAVTGGAPFQAANAGALARRVLGGRPAAIRTTTPAEVDLQKVFDRGFSRTPSRRHANIAALRDDLRSWLAVHAPAQYAALPELPEPPAPPEEAPREEAAAPETAPSDVAVQEAASEPPPEITVAEVEPSPVTPSVAPPRSGSSTPPVAKSSPPPPEAESVPQGHAPDAEADRAAVLVAAPAAPSAPPARGRRIVLAGIAAAVAIAGVVALVARPDPARPAPGAPSAEAASPTSAPVALTVPPPPGTSVARPPPAASASAVPAAVDLDACVAAWFPPESLDPDTDLAFICSEREGRPAATKLRRAILAGGKGKRITDAMHEWQRFGWFEVPVVATLRARCCPGAQPIEVPRLAGSSCTPPRDAIQALAVATAQGTDVAGAIRAYRKVVSCLVEVGDFPAYGQPGAIGVGEEPAFRAFADRGQKR